jgi:hypothetical protein
MARPDFFKATLVRPSVIGRRSSAKIPNTDRSVPFGKRVRALFFYAEDSFGGPSNSAVSPRAAGPSGAVAVQHARQGDFPYVADKKSRLRHIPFNLQSESIGAAPSGNLQVSLTLGPKISACTQLGMFAVAGGGSIRSLVIGLRRLQRSRLRSAAIFALCALTQTLIALGSCACHK